MVIEKIGKLGDDEQEELLEMLQKKANILKQKPHLNAPIAAYFKSFIDIPKEEKIKISDKQQRIDKLIDHLKARGKADLLKEFTVDQLLQKQDELKKRLEAAKKDVFGPVSYDRAIENVTESIDIKDQSARKFI